MIGLPVQAAPVAEPAPYVESAAAAPAGSLRCYIQKPFPAGVGWAHTWGSCDGRQIAIGAGRDLGVRYGSSDEYAADMQRLRQLLSDPPPRTPSWVAASGASAALFIALLLTLLRMPRRSRRRGGLGPSVITP